MTRSLKNNTDIAIVGGGLAGLTAAIHLVRKGLGVVIYEKESYPSHKVCGEYLSREIQPYLRSLSIDLQVLRPVEIDKLVYSTPSGKTVKAPLPLGGLGVSRYALDNFLMEMAKGLGVEVINLPVTSVNFENDEFIINKDQEGQRNTNLAFGAFGKRSALDKKLNRDFIENKTGWLAIKAHYKLEQYPVNTVSLHNFKGGYCGLSKTETGAVNACYLATYKSFKKYKDPDQYKKEVLSTNPHLKTFFSHAQPIFGKDLSIAQIYFDKKSLIEDHMLMLGDAAGMIHPLCGNGMAMAIHSAKIASEAVLKHYHSAGFNRLAMEQDYKKQWRINFNSRLRTGKALQKILLNPALAETSQNIINTFPFLLQEIISRTHGKPVA